ncbi:MAG: carbohydrate porin [Phycisphaerae bacterium]|nr:carbohydrate porin [Phycisphaerae bacterium]
MQQMRCDPAVALLVSSFVSALAAASVAAPPNDTVAGAGGGLDDAIEVIAPAAAGGIPAELPGQTRGAVDTARPAPVDPSQREWFGGRPIWEWSRLTGDWAGARTSLEERGVTVEGSFTIEWADAISDAFSRKWVSRNIFDLNVTLETEPLFGLKGGTFYLDVASSDSTNGGSFVPVTQWSSTIEIQGSTFQIANAWYQQELFDGVLRGKVGKIDPTTEFGYLNATAGYLNLASLMPTTWQTVPTYPYGSLGGLIFVNPCEHFYVGGGVFNATFVRDQFLQDDLFDDGVWAVGEMGFTCKELGPVRDLRIAGGGWYDSRDFERFDGSGTESTYGLYGMAEARLFAPTDGGVDDTRGVWLFGQVNYADPSTVITRVQFGSGAALHGTFPGRDSDKMGIYVGNVQYSGAPSLGLDDSETVVELFYAMQVTPAITFTPDIQFFTNAGGDDAEDPIVFTMRLGIAF